MGTRTWTRRGVLTAAGRRRAGGVAQYQPFSLPTRTTGGRTPAYIQKAMQGGGDAVLAAAQAGRQITPEIRAYIKEKLGLDLLNPTDAQLFADLTGVFALKNGSANVEVVYGVQGSLRTSAGGLLTSAKDIDVDRTGVYVYNDLTNKRVRGAPRLGFFALARQAGAAKELSKRLGKTVYLSATLASDNKNNGVHTFGQLGYQIQLTPNERMRLDTPDLPKIFRDAGFRSPNTNHDVLLSTSSTGESGFAAWRRLLPKTISLFGQWIFHPNNPTVQGDQVMTAYAQQYGYKYPL